MNGNVNVIVSDGFTGNVALKTAEGTAKFITDSLKTSLIEIPTSKIVFYFECFNMKKELLNKGDVTLVFVNSKTKKPCKPPAIIIDSLTKFL